MIKKYYFFLLPFLFTSFISCDRTFDDDNYEAYFGGEIINPQNNFVLFLKDDKVIDTILLR